MLDLSARPRLAPGARLRFDRFEACWMLVAPERALLLRGSAPRVLQLCDGRRSLAEIVDELVRCHPGEDRAALQRDVLELLYELERRTLLRTGAA